MRKFIIGTRGSLLATTQCNQIKKEIEKLTGREFELKLIKTSGDLITNAPLWSLDGKDFFTKELDHALLASEVDLVVHSYKDLGSERPEGIQLAAVTKRTYANDILICRTDIVEKLQSKMYSGDFRVGTSSPRRMKNIETTLKPLLPFGAELNINICSAFLRGNVNSRIKKLVDGEFEAILLALPGIERLAQSPESSKELDSLFKIHNCQFMVMPQSIFPSSAAQGALAIECRSSDTELINLLKCVEDKKTVDEIKRERLAFVAYGGGCHLAVGINVKAIDDFYIHTHKGEIDGKTIHFRQLENQKTTIRPGKTFIGNESQDLLIKKTPIDFKLNPHDNIWVTTSNYLSDHFKKSGVNWKGLVYSAGVKSWHDLASLGFWVCGSADGLGIDEIKKLESSYALKLISKKNSAPDNSLKILTHENSHHEYGQIIPVYKRECIPNPEFKKYLTTIQNFYWMSFSQFQMYSNYCPEILAEDKYHFSGLGKTWTEFKNSAFKNRITPLLSPKDLHYESN